MFLASIILAADGPGDFVPRDPNWGAMGFASPLIKLLLGVFMAAVVIYCVFKAIVAFKNIGGADSSHKAQEGGMALAFSLAAIVGIYFFYDLFVGLVASAS